MSLGAGSISVPGRHRSTTLPTLSTSWCAPRSFPRQASRSCRPADGRNAILRKGGGGLSFGQSNALFPQLCSRACAFTLTYLAARNLRLRQFVDRDFQSKRHTGCSHGLRYVNGSGSTDHNSAGQTMRPWRAGYGQKWLSGHLHNKAEIVSCIFKIWRFNFAVHIFLVGFHNTLKINQVCLKFVTVLQQYEHQSSHSMLQAFKPLLGQNMFF